MGALTNRIAKANAMTEKVLAYNPKAAQLQEILCNYVQSGKKATDYNIAEYVNRGHSGENCAFLYMQFCTINNIAVDNSFIVKLQ